MFPDRRRRIAEEEGEPSHPSVPRSPRRKPNPHDGGIGSGLLRVLLLSSFSLSFCPPLFEVTGFCLILASSQCTPAVPAAVLHAPMTSDNYCSALLFVLSAVCSCCSFLFFFSDFCFSLFFSWLHASLTSDFPK